MAGKAWADLTPAYRARLERKGYTESMHQRGVSKVEARGHANDTVWREFKKLDGHQIVPGFDRLPLKEKLKVARLWKMGFMSPGPHGDDKKEARIMFLGWMDEHRSPMDEENRWKKYRDDYQMMFGSGVR